MTRDRPRILVVDDARENRALVARMLGDGYETLFAGDGAEALAVAAEALPDLVLLDIMMPGIDGYQVCSALKRDPVLKAVPVIFLSARSEAADELRGLELGGVDYIAKPLSAAIVRARVRNHLELKRCRDRLEQLSITDELTGIANRRRGLERLELEWRRARRSRAPLSLLLIDIDCFKHYNDSYGHPAGDECLRRVAGALAAAVRRPADLVARFGGEEFLCLLPETDPAGARYVGEVMRQGVKALAIPHRSSPAADHVTLSVGAATLSGRVEGEFQRLVDLADKMLYAAKQQGRDRVVAAEPSVGI